MLGVLGVGAVGLFGVEQAAGAATVGTFKQVNACTASPDTYDGGGLDGWAQRVALSALNGAACELHTSRERLVLSLDPNSGYSNVTWDKATAKKAIQSGLKRAIKDGEDRGGLPGWAGSVLDFATDHAPIDWILNLFPYFK